MTELAALMNGPDGRRFERLCWRYARRVTAGRFAELFAASVVELEPGDGDWADEILAEAQRASPPGVEAHVSLIDWDMLEALLEAEVRTGRKM